MVDDEIRARSDGRSKRPRDQPVPIGMKIANMPKPNATSIQNIDENRSFSESYDKKSYDNRRSPKQVTDDSGESEDTEKGKLSNGGSSLQGKADVRQPQHQLEDQHIENSKLNQQHDQETRSNKKSFQQESTHNHDGSVMEDYQQSSASSVRDITLPQHETIERVEPLDISYRSTPACIELRAALMSRLRFVAPTGRIQVVS